MIQILPATKEAMTEIAEWLEVEEKAYQAAKELQSQDWDLEVEVPTRGFLCNWPGVVKSFEEDPNNVHVLHVNGATAGFIDKFDILEVRPALRGLGYGRRLAEFMKGRAFQLGYSLLEIGIAPESALPFWRRMGFTADPRRIGPGGIYAYLRFDRPAVLGDGPRVPYRIAFYPPARDYRPDVQPFEVFEGEGEQLNQRLRLARRAYCFDAAGSTSPDCVMRIEVARREVFEDKIKRPKAAELGRKLDAGYVYYLEELLLP